MNGSTESAVRLEQIASETLTEAQQWGLWLSPRVIAIDGPAGSGKRFLLTLKNSPCAIPSSDDVVDLSQLELQDEMQANSLAAAIGNRWSICLFKYVGPAQTIRPPTPLGPGIRVRNGSIVD